MLNNLGYANSNSNLNVRNFQRDYGDLVNPPLKPTGQMDIGTKNLLTHVYRTCADNLRQTGVSQT